MLLAKLLFSRNREIILRKDHFHPRLDVVQKKRHSARVVQISLGLLHFLLPENDVMLIRIFCRVQFHSLKYV